MTQKPYTVYSVEGRPRVTWQRIALWTSVALVVVLLAGAGGAYLWFRSQVVGANQRVDQEVISVLSSKPPSTFAPTTVTSVAEAEEEPEPEPPSGMNVLVLGSDRRANEEGTYGRSDTIILLHVDPDNDFLSLLSLPRDLRVSVDGHGKQKINAAYAYGGPALTILTVEQVTGVDINHYLEVDFQAFIDITDALDGVYVDVDRRYYNDNPRWELIKLAPGYQLLGGSDALDYVRFRHDRNGDFGRMERQQRFLGALREQAMDWQLPLKLPGLISALFNNVTTDLGANDILRLAYWAVRLGGENIRQTTLVAPTEDIDGASYVVASSERIREAVTSFLSLPGSEQAASSTTQATEAEGSPATSTTPAPSGPDLKAIEVDVLNGSGRSGAAAEGGAWLVSLGAEVKTVGNADVTGRESTVVKGPAGDVDEAEAVAEALGDATFEVDPAVERVTVVLGLDFELPAGFVPPTTIDNIPDSSEWKALATMVPFALQAPSYLPEGYDYTDRMPQTGATYDIEVGRGTKPALRMIYRLTNDGDRTDQYMGITETTWTDAPIASDGLEVEVDGVTYTVVGSTDKVSHVWWESDGVLYWVSNTLSHLLSREEMLKIAESMIAVPGP